MRLRTAGVTVAAAGLLITLAPGAAQAATAASRPAPGPACDRVDLLPDATPSDYRVVGVRPGSFLNLRDLPCGHVVGRLAAGSAHLHATGKVARSGRTVWRQVTAGRSFGWVAASYLAPQGH
jgi:hypothetical protein